MPSLQKMPRDWLRCLMYNTLRIPITGGNKKVSNICSFAGHAPKPEWIEEFFAKGNDFWSNNSLGPNQVKYFKVFLPDCGLVAKRTYHPQRFLIWFSNWDGTQVLHGVYSTQISHTTMRRFVGTSTICRLIHLLTERQQWIFWKTLAYLIAMQALWLGI